jgi:hypothetical protein
MPNFPEHYPENCPPEDATVTSGDVYRITKTTDLSEDDFLSYYDLQKQSTACECAKRSISLFKTLDNARHRLRLTPRLGTAISKGTLDEDAGKMKVTNAKSGHIDWWVYCEVVPKDYFSEAILCQT